MNKSLITTVFLLATLTFLGAIELEVPTKKTIAVIPAGEGLGALSFGVDNANEPHTPVSIQQSRFGDFLVQDAFQDIALFDRSMRYRTSIGKGYQGMKIEGDFLVAWNYGMDPQQVDIYQLSSGKVSKYASGEFFDIGSLSATFAASGLLLFWTSESNIAVIQIAPKKLSVVQTNDLPAQMTSIGFTIKDQNLYKDNLGILTESAEEFFLDVGGSELQFAETKNGRDKANIASGRIFGIDSAGSRYIYHNLGRIAIATNTGVLIRVFDIRIDAHEPVFFSKPTIDSSGDIVYIESHHTGHRVIKIVKNW